MLNGSGRRLTILGMGPSANERRWDIGKYIEGGEVWTLNNAYLNFAHAEELITRWFELHSWQYLKEWDAGVPDHFERLAKVKCPVYTTEHLPCIRNQVQVDWVEVFHALHKAGAKNYFLGSPSMMLALALYEHDRGETIEAIQSYGVDTDDIQHHQQRQSWAYWCGQVDKRGIPMGGTMQNFMFEEEHDAGLVGLRGRIGDGVQARLDAEAAAVDPETEGVEAGVLSLPDVEHAATEKKEVDCVVVGVSSRGDHYEEAAERLANRAGELGMKTIITHVTPSPPTPISRVCQLKFANSVREALQKYGKPILFMGVDDELLKAPVVSSKEFDVGIIDNPEAKIIHTHLRVAPFALFKPTEATFKFIDYWEKWTQLTNDHRALQMAVDMMYSTRVRIENVTKDFEGCIRMTPHGARDRACMT